VREHSADSASRCVAEVFAAVRTAVRRASAVRAALWTAAAGLAVVALAVALAATLRAGTAPARGGASALGWLPWLALASTAAAVVTAAVLAYRPVPSDLYVARLIEQIRPELKNALVTLVEVSADPSMAAALARRAARVLSRDPPRAYLPEVSYRRPGGALAAALLAVGVALWTARTPGGAPWLPGAKAGEVAVASGPVAAAVSAGDRGTAPQHAARAAPPQAASPQAVPGGDAPRASAVPQMTPDQGTADGEPSLQGTGPARAVGSSSRCVAGRGPASAEVREGPGAPAPKGGATGSISDDRAPPRGSPAQVPPAGSATASRKPAKGPGRGPSSGEAGGSGHSAAPSPSSRPGSAALAGGPSGRQAPGAPAPSIDQASQGSSTVAHGPGEGLKRPASPASAEPAGRGAGRAEPAGASTGPDAPPSKAVGGAERASSGTGGAERATPPPRAGRSVAGGAAPGGGEGAKGKAPSGERTGAPDAERPDDSPSGGAASGGGVGPSTSPSTMPRPPAAGSPLPEREPSTDAPEKVLDAMRRIRQELEMQGRAPDPQHAPDAFLGRMGVARSTYRRYVTAWQEGRLPAGLAPRLPPPRAGRGDDGSAAAGPGGEVHGPTGATTGAGAAEAVVLPWAGRPEGAALEETVQAAEARVSPRLRPAVRAYFERLARLLRRAEAAGWGGEP